MNKFLIYILFALLLVACGDADVSAPLPTGTAPLTEAAISETPPTEVIVSEPTEALAESESDNSMPTQAPDSAESETAPTTTFQIEAWADNWFAAYLGEELIVEDSVSINTERSFNAETATFEAAIHSTSTSFSKTSRRTTQGWNISASAISKWATAALSCS